METDPTETISTDAQGSDPRLVRQRGRILAADNTHCFSERESILQNTSKAWADLPQPEQYCTAFETLMSGLSVPVAEEDVILGRMVEGEPPCALTGIAGGGQSHPANPFSVAGHMQGHMTIDYGRLVREGLARIASSHRACQAHRALAGTQYVDRCIHAIVDFSRRYADAAEDRASSAASGARECLARAANALRHVPERPAESFFEGLQAIWIVHWVLSCVVGGRDFALGRLDQYLLPLYERDLANGTLTPDEATGLLAHFLMKTNEIAGTASAFFNCKPVPCAAAKQYILLGGTSSDGSAAENPLSFLIVEAAKRVRLPQPDLLVRWTSAASPPWKTAVIGSIRVLSGQVQLINESVMAAALEQSGIERAVADTFTISGCSRPDLPGVRAAERYHNAVAWLIEAIGHDRTGMKGSGDRCRSMQDILSAFRDIARREIGKSVAGGSASPGTFNLESALGSNPGADSTPCDGAPDLCCHLFAGLATIADSLYALNRLVFVEQRVSLASFVAIVASDFAQHEALRQEVLLFPKFGNDVDEADQWATAAAHSLCDALESQDAPGIRYGGFFSLVSHVSYGHDLPATPDGRLAGTPISENQSPVVGMDRAGPTALLKSVAKLPFRRGPGGGLNIRLSRSVTTKQIEG